MKGALRRRTLPKSDVERVIKQPDNTSLTNRKQKFSVNVSQDVIHMLRLILLVHLLFLFSVSYSQPQPQKVAPGIVSEDGVFGFTLSPDGTSALWVKSNGRRDTLTIVQSSRVKGEWQTPTPAPFSGNPKWKDIDPVFSPDGNTILFQSTRPVEGNPDRNGFDIWAVMKTKNGWSEPYHLGDDINSDASESYASMTRRGDIYFMKEDPNGEGSSDIFVSRLINGKYTTPESIGSPINTTNRESNPFISADESFIIYFSSDSAGYGEVDLFISFFDGVVWSTPRNMGPKINSVEAEFCPFFHEKQGRLYFARQRKQQNRYTENIFSVDLDVNDFR